MKISKGLVYSMSHSNHKSIFYWDTKIHYTIEPPVPKQFSIGTEIEVGFSVQIPSVYDNLYHQILNGKKKQTYKDTNFLGNQIVVIARIRNNSNKTQL